MVSSELDKRAPMAAAPLGRACAGWDQANLRGSGAAGAIADGCMGLAWPPYGL